MSLKVAWIKLLSLVHLVRQKGTAHLPRLDCHELHELVCILVLSRVDAIKYYSSLPSRWHGLVAALSCGDILPIHL